MVLWVSEASEVNNLTVLAVRPNPPKKKNKIASSGSVPFGSYKKVGVGAVVKCSLDVSSSDNGCPEIKVMSRKREWKILVKKLKLV